MAMTPNEAALRRELLKLQTTANERISAQNAKLEEQNKSMTIMVALALHYADVAATQHAAMGVVGAPPAPLFPDTIPDAVFKGVWGRALAGEGLAVQIRGDAVTVMRVVPTAVPTAAAPSMIQAP